MPVIFEEACKNNDCSEEVNTMLTQNWPIPIEIRTKKSESALMLACGNGAEEVCQVLIDNRCDLEARDLHKKTALFYCVEKGHTNVVKLLTEKGADVNKRDEDNNTALHIATAANNIGIAKLLLNFNADINAKGKHQQTLIHIASLNGNLDIVREYANLTSKKERAKTKGDAYGKYPIHYAAENGFDEVVQYLVDKMEYDVNQQSSAGKTAVQYALDNNHLEVVKVLLRLTATVNEQDRKTLHDIGDEEIRDLLHNPTGIIAYVILTPR